MNPKTFSHYTKYTINYESIFIFEGSSTTSTTITDTDTDGYITSAGWFGD